MKHILVVDDNERLLDIIGCFLSERSEYKISKANSGAVALQKLLSDESIDLVITDIMMPGLSGFNLLQRIKERNPHKPEVIFITGNLNLDVDRAFSEGVLDILWKPFSKQDLLTTITEEIDSEIQNNFKKINIELESIKQASEKNIVNFGNNGFFLNHKYFNIELTTLDLVEFNISIKESETKEKAIKGIAQVKWQRENKLNLPIGCGLKIFDHKNSVKSIIRNFINLENNKTSIPLK